MLYIGENGSDPVTTAPSTTIFSDRELQIPLANPQTLNAFGESTNKIWIDGKYSLQANNSNGVQKFQDLDAGETAESGITTLSNVQGTNTVIAEASPTITEYVDKEVYVFTVTTTNTGAATLNINGVGQQPIIKNKDKALVAGDLTANEIIVVIYNESSTDFSLVNQDNIGWEFVSSATASSTATISFTGLDVGYDYMVVGYGIQPETNIDDMSAQVGITGPTYRTTGYLASSGIIDNLGNSTGNKTTNGWQIMGTPGGNSADETGNFEITFYDPVAATDTYANSVGHQINTEQTNFVTQAGGFHSTAESHTAIRLLYSTGNIAIGEFKLYRRLNT